MTDGNFSDPEDDDKEDDERFIPMSEKEIVREIYNRADQLEWIFTGEIHRYPGSELKTELLSRAIMRADESKDSDTYAEAMERLRKKYITLMNLMYITKPALRRQIDALKKDMVEYRMEHIDSEDDKEVSRYIRIQGPTPWFWGFGRRMMADLKKNFSTDDALRTDYSPDPKVAEQWGKVPNPIKGFYWLIFKEQFNDFDHYFDGYMDSIENPDSYTEDDLDGYGF